MIKKIECIVREEKLEKTLELLRNNGVPGATITQVKGFGKENLYSDPYLKTKVKIEIYVEGKEVKGILQVLTKSNQTGRLGDGKIVVSPVENLVRIRTGEKLAKALY